VHLRAGGMKQYPYTFQVALDGNGINGFEGQAGVCSFLYDPSDDSYAYKIKYYPGAAAGHALSLNPGRTIGFLGNAGQHLLFYDAKTLEEVDRISTLRFETNDTTIRGSTHLIWLNDREFVTAIGDYFYRFDVFNLSKGEKLGPHNVKLPHAMKRTRSGRYICYGSMDHPSLGEAREVGVWDVATGEAIRIELPATCWHLVEHPSRDLFYPVSFRVLPQPGGDYHQWAMAFFKEYAFEIDAAEKRVLRHWASGREVPAHINSDITISDRELIFCNGGSQTIVCVDLESFREYRVIDERPGLLGQFRHPRQMLTQVYDVFARGSFFASTRDFFAALRVSRFTLMDSVHACQLSADQSLLFTANRGLNHITVYDYATATERLRVRLPDFHEYQPGLSRVADPRLGLHHGYLVSPAAPALAGAPPAARGVGR
jgi:hypothetical protein